METKLEIRILPDVLGKGKGQTFLWQAVPSLAGCAAAVLPAKHPLQEDHRLLNGSGTLQQDRGVGGPMHHVCPLQPPSNPFSTLVKCNTGLKNKAGLAD